MRIGPSIGLLALTAALVAVPADAASTTVKARDSYFTPDFRVVVTGDTVIWNVEGSEGHTITAYPNSPVQFDSSPSTDDSCDPTGGGGGLLPGSTTAPVTPDCLDQGDSFQQTFDQPATIDYYCKIHGNPKRKPKASVNAAAQPCGMCARIVVKTPSTLRPATRNPSPGSVSSSTPTEEPSESGSPEPSPSEIDPSLSGQASDQQNGGSGAPRAVIATFAVMVLSGLGYLVWRRYFQTT